MLEDITITLPDTTNTTELKEEVPESSITITRDGNISLVIASNISEELYTYSDDGGGNKYTAFTETIGQEC